MLFDVSDEDNMFMTSTEGSCVNQIALKPSLGKTYVRVRSEETPIELTCFTEKLKYRQEKCSLQRRCSS